MKKYVNNNCKLVIGTAREIRSLYKNMVNRGYYPVFSDFPKFKTEGMYGIEYTDDASCFDDGISVVNADTIVRYFAEGVIV